MFSFSLLPLLQFFFSTFFVQVTWVPEIGLVSSSVDSTIKIYDFVREKVRMEVDGWMDGETDV